MTPRWGKLTRPAEFERVFAAPARVRFNAFLVMALPNTAGYPRLGLVVSRRILKRAVARNRVKRCIRAAFALAADTLPACDFVVRLVAEPVAGREVRDASSALVRVAGRVRERTAPDS